MCQGKSSGGPWLQEERREPINLLELKAAHMTVMTFAERLKPESIHLQMDNHAALAYIRKMEVKVNQNMNQVGQGLWKLLIGNGITIIVEYLPGKLNPLPDKESREKDSSKWKLNPKIFQKMFYKRSCPEIDLFATRVTTHLQAYFSWRKGQLSQGIHAFQRSWKNLSAYTFPPFSLVGRVLKKAFY